MAGAEVIGVQGWVFATLAADAQLQTLLGGAGRIFVVGSSPPPDQMPSRYLLITPPAASSDGMGLGGHRWLNASVWLIKVVDQNVDPRPAAAANARVDALLHRGRGTDPLAKVVSFLRTGMFSSPEVDKSFVTYQHIGGYYRAEAQ